MPSPAACTIAEASPYCMLRSLADPCLRGWICGLLAVVPATASAHGDDAHAETLAWTFDAWVTLPLLLSLLWFALGYLRVARRSTHPRMLRRRGLLFATGWLTMAGALVTPLHAAGERSFTAHMIEHELLMLIGTPLLVLSQPVGIALWALPRRARLALGGLHRRPWFLAGWSGVSGPITATLLQALALWLWHVPVLFELALASDGWHIAQHLSFVVTALLFWTAMLDPRRLRAGTGVAIGCLFVTAIVGGTLGALMALSDSPWYASYIALGMTPFGLSPQQDQQLAGLLMWVPGGLVHLLAALWLLATWLRDPDTSPRTAEATD